MLVHSKVYFQHARLKAIIDYLRHMGKTCYIDGSRVAVEIDKQTMCGHRYTSTEYVTTMQQAKAVIMDD